MSVYNSDMMGKAAIQRREEAFRMVLPSKAGLDGPRAVVDDDWLVDEDVLGIIHICSGCCFFAVVCRAFHLEFAVFVHVRATRSGRAGQRWSKQQR